MNDFLALFFKFVSLGLSDQWCSGKLSQTLAALRMSVNYGLEVSNPLINVQNFKLRTIHSLLCGCTDLNKM